MAGLGATVSWNVVLDESVPSLTVIVIFATPVCPAAGVTVTVRLPPLPPNTIPLSGTTAVLSELAETVRLPAGVSTSLTVNGIAGVEVLTAISRFVIVETTGGLLTALTVTLKVRVTMLLDVPLSRTVTVTVALPNWFVTGLKDSEPVEFGLV